MAWAYNSVCKSKNVYAGEKGNDSSSLPASQKKDRGSVTLVTLKLTVNHSFLCTTSSVFSYFVDGLKQVSIYNVYFDVQRKPWVGSSGLL